MLPLIESLGRFSSRSPPVGRPSDFMRREQRECVRRRLYRVLCPRVHLKKWDVCRPESDMPCPPCVCFITSKAKLKKNVFGGTRRPCAWCRRATSTGCSRGAGFGHVTRAVRCLLAYVSAWHRRQEARLPCLRPRACGRARHPRGSSSSRPATSQHGSSLDGTLPSMLSALCTASTSCLGRPTGPERAASGEMAR